MQALAFVKTLQTRPIRVAAVTFLNSTAVFKLLGIDQSVISMANCPTFTQL